MPITHLGINKNVCGRYIFCSHPPSTPSHTRTHTHNSLYPLALLSGIALGGGREQETKCPQARTPFNNLLPTTDESVFVHSCLLSTQSYLHLFFKIPSSLASFFHLLPSLLLNLCYMKAVLSNIPLFSSNIYRVLLF